jgi:hypothetical protein
LIAQAVFNKEKRLGDKHAKGSCQEELTKDQAFLPKGWLSETKVPGDNKRHSSRRI